MLIYADDVAMFIKPYEFELSAARLDCFGEASGLRVNLNKSAIIPVRCGQVNVETIIAAFPCKLASFSHGTVRVVTVLELDSPVTDLLG